MSIRLISQEYASVVSQNDILQGSTYFSNAYKDHREWHILGSTQRIYANSNAFFPSHARKRERPDFYLYDSAGLLVHGLEVTMVLPPDHKVHKHHKQWEQSGLAPFEYEYPAYTEHWNWLRTAITEKAKEPYIPDCALLVYFNVAIGDTNERSMSFSDAIEAEYLCHQSGDFGIGFLGNSKIREIIVIASGLDELATIYPSFRYLKC